jgi:hypothetical protein
MIDIDRILQERIVDIQKTIEYMQEIQKKRKRESKTLSTSPTTIAKKKKTK